MNWYKYKIPTAMQGFFVHSSDIQPISFSDLNNPATQIL